MTLKRITTKEGEVYYVDSDTGEKIETQEKKSKVTEPILESQGQVVIKKHKNTLSILGFVFLVPALFVWGLWLYVVSTNIPDVQKTELYMSYFPEFLQSRGALSNFVLLSTMVSIILSYFGLKRANNYLKVVSSILIGIGCLIILLQLFSML